jgi:uncharacterized protein
VRLRGAGLAFLGLLALSAGAQEVIPPSPAAHFNDYASVVSPATASALDSELAQFERTTSNQVVVAIYPTMQSDSSVEDYTVRVAQSWHAGLKGRDNGAVLFIFAKSHQIYLQVGYGLEGSLPDALAKRIISDEIVPAFKRGDYDAGVTAGVHAILAATRGEYHGSGRTVADGRRQNAPVPVFLIFFIILVIASVIRSRSTMYHNGGRRGFGGFIPIILPGGGGGFGGGGGGGGGGFSGGGGGFGGGGAGGSW